MIAYCLYSIVIILFCWDGSFVWWDLSFQCWKSASWLPELPLVGSNASGSFSNNDGDGNKNVKKAIGLITKTTLHVHLHFLVHWYIGAVTARLQHEISWWDVLWRMWTRQQIFLSLSNLGVVSKNSTPGNFSYIWHLKWAGIIETAFEKTLLI